MRLVRSFFMIFAALLFAAVATAGFAGAQADDDYPATTAVTVLDDPGVTTSAAPTTGAVSPTTGSTQVLNSGTLPVTGGDVLGLAAIGFAAIGTGVVLVRRKRSLES